MILADKIIQLRKKNGWSQEELAEKMNVTRQSVSKWESTASIPDINKILELAKIFGVTTDYLLKDEMEMEEFSDDQEENRTVISMEEADHFMKIRFEWGKQIAFGVVMCILSPVVLLVLGALSEEGRITEARAGGIGIVVLLIMVAAATAVFIYSSMKMNRYRYIENGDFELAYGVDGVIREKSKAFEKQFAAAVAVGTVLCIISIVPLIIAGVMETPDYIMVIMVAVLLIIISAAVYIFISNGNIKESYDMLLKAENFDPVEKERNKRGNKFAGIYWPLIVAVYLAVSLPTARWEITWVIWPVAALLFVAVYAALRKEV